MAGPGQLEQRLASFSRLIVFDKRGTGLSDHAPGPVVLEDTMQDVLAVLDSWERFKAERSLAQRVAGAVTDDPDTLEFYFGYARQGRSALWVHVPDDADAKRAVRALADHQVLHLRHYGHDSQQDIRIRRGQHETREGKTCMTTTSDGDGLRRATGWLLAIGAVTFAVAATILSSTFNWPDILREPPDVVLPEFVAGGTSLVWTWFAVAWTYAILLVPILLLPAALGRRDDPVLRAATFVGAASVLSSLIGFLRWVFVVPALADTYTAGDATTKAAVAAAWIAQHQFGGALLGEHLGQLLAIGWSITVSILILRTGILWRWVGWAGLIASVLYLFNQGDILATAVPGFPVFDLAGFIGSSLWAVWLIALGVAVLRAPIRRPTAATAPAPRPH